MVLVKVGQLVVHVDGGLHVLGCDDVDGAFLGGLLRWRKRVGGWVVCIRFCVSLDVQASMQMQLFANSHVCMESCPHVRKVVPM